MSSLKKMKLILNEDRLTKYAFRYVCKKLQTRTSGKRLKKEVAEAVIEAANKVWKQDRWRRTKGRVNQTIKDELEAIVRTMDGNTARSRWLSLLQPRVVKPFNRFKRIRGIASNRKE